MRQACRHFSLGLALCYFKGVVGYTVSTCDVSLLCLSLRLRLVLGFGGTELDDRSVFVGEELVESACEEGERDWARPALPLACPGREENRQQGPA